MYACGHCDFATSNGIEANRHEDSTGHVVDELDPTDSLELWEDDLETENPKDVPPWKSQAGWEAALDRADLARKQSKGE